ncbi:preprotein translocase subunit YajC [Gardnerella vaginalis]|uniref:preprotein translocase subunit YajC n=1 Tax=Gardnerella vaginalis TaxID=2702 RepID=UPI0039EF063C
MPQFFSQYGMLIVLVIAMVGIMWFQSRSMKKRQTELRSFHDSLKPGVEVITIGGIIGKVVSVDADHEEIILDSEGSLLRVSFRAVNRVYVRVDFNSYDKEDSAEGANNNADSAEDNESQESQESNESNEVQESSESNENKEN